MQEILEEKFGKKKRELDSVLLAKFNKRTRCYRKRIAAGTRIIASKLPPDFFIKRKRKIPKIDDDDEMDSAVSSIEMINCPSTVITKTANNPGNNYVTNQDINLNNSVNPPPPQPSSTPEVLDDFDVAGIDENLLLECLLVSNLNGFEDINFTLDSEDFDPVKFEQQQQQLQAQQYINLTESSNNDQQQFNEVTSMDMLNELINDIGIVPEIDYNQQFIDLQLSQFRVEPPQESILSSSSPFPASMSSPSIPSTSPPQQSNLLEELKVSDISFTIINSPSPTDHLSPKETFSTPTPPSPTPSTSPSPQQPSSRPSYGKDIFLLLNEQSNETDSDSSEDD